MSSARRIAWFLGIWLLVLLLYSAVSLSLPRGSQSLKTFGNLVQCVVPLLSNAGLLLNAGTPHWRRNLFWMLMAMSCTLWMIGQFQWTYYEVYLQKPMPALYAGDIVFFLRGIPMMAALSLRPHRKRGEIRLGFGSLDFVLLLTWWTFLYVFSVLPWIYATPQTAQYNYEYNLVTNIQNLVIVAGFAILWMRARGAWRLVYANLFAAASLYMLAALTEDSSDTETDSMRGESVWASRMAMAAVISLPLFAIYTLRLGHETPEVRDFRLMATLVATLPLAFLVFLRAHLADQDRWRLLARSEQSVDNLKRLQAQIVQSEKLVSLGQLAAGAAHEINNPLAAILGFSDLLADDPAIPEKARATAAKIRDQARRTKTLVGNLLSFARQVPAERSLLDINTVVNNAVQLRALDLRSGTTQIQLQLESVLPGVRGDGNQLMQVFFNIISNALDAMEAKKGGVLTIKTLRDRGNVVVLLSDTGPGIREPHRVFDPFYTTKPVGKGTGLGLSICFGIIQEHGGKILCYNRQEGGAVFRVELPAVLAAFPTKDMQLAGTLLNPQKPS